MSLTIVPMIAPKVLADVFRALGKPNRIYLTGRYDDAEGEIAVNVRKTCGFTPNYVRVNLEVGADSMTEKQILALYGENYADFNARMSQGGQRKKGASLEIKELVWFKSGTKGGVTRSSREHYYLSFNRYHFRGRIDPKSEPVLIRRMLGIMKKYNLAFPVHLCS